MEKPEDRGHPTGESESMLRRVEQFEGSVRLLGQHEVSECLLEQSEGSARQLWKSEVSECQL